MSSLTRKQYDFLVEPLRPSRVQKLQGNSHLEQWDIRRHLIRAFGFGGFDVRTKSVNCVSQIQHTLDKEGKPIPEHKPRWSVVYTAEVRLTVKAPDGSVLAVYEDGATGDSQNQPSLGDAHDMALKTALSQALKRCAVNLGDQFGLSLYNDGRSDAVVLRSLVTPDGKPTGGPVEDAPVRPEPGAVPDETVFEGFVDEVDRAKSPGELTDIWRRAKKTTGHDITESQYDRVVQLCAARQAEFDQAKAEPVQGELIPT